MCNGHCTLLLGTLLYLLFCFVFLNNPGAVPGCQASLLRTPFFPPRMRLAVGPPQRTFRLKHSSTSLSLGWELVIVLQILETITERERASLASENQATIPTPMNCSLPITTACVCGTKPPKHSNSCPNPSGSEVLHMIQLTIRVGTEGREGGVHFLGCLL